jgi:hypothetical protein
VAGVTQQRDTIGSMKSVHVAARVNQSGGLELEEPLPEEFRSQAVSVLVMDAADNDNGQEERAWREFASTEFLTGYADSDAIYDQLT